MHFPYVGGAGKNKFPLTLAGMKAANTDGTWVGNVYSYRNVDITVITDSADNVLAVSANGTATGGSIIFSFTSGFQYQLFPEGSYALSDSADTSLITDRAYISLERKLGQSGQSNYVTTNTYNRANTFTVDYSQYDYYYPVLYIPVNGAVNNVVFYPQIETGSTVTSFAPYSNICPISGRDRVVITRSDGDEISEDFTIQFGQTVYGGTVDLVTGAASVTKAIAIFDGSNDENWANPASSWSNQHLFQTINAIPDCVKVIGYQTLANVISDKVAGVTPDYISRADYRSGIALGGTKNEQYVYVGLGLNQTLEEYKAYLSSNPLQVCFELATPIELTLTPTEVQMLKGYNRVTIDNGSIELGYIAKLT
jgi:hypothetical protein